MASFWKPNRKKAGAKKKFSSRSAWTKGWKVVSTSAKKKSKAAPKRAARKSFFAHWGGRAARPGWKREGRAHAIAAKIGWTYRKYASDFRKFSAYAARATKRGKHKGLTISRRSLAIYRKTRRTPLSRLAGRREWVKHTSTPKKVYARTSAKATRRFGMLYNASSYQKFVAKHTKGAKSAADARRRFRSAAAAWRRSKGGRKGRKAKSRKNPVLPVSYNNNKRRKSRRSNSNPLFRTAAGRFSKRGGRKLRRIGGGGWHSNKRGYRSNGALLPYTAYSNPVGALTATAESLTSPDLWMKTVLPLSVGFLGTNFVAFTAVKMIAPAGTEYKGLVKHGSRLATAAVLSVGTGLVMKDGDFAAKVLAGGLVAFLGGVLSDVLGDQFSKATGLGEMSDLADDLTEELKSKIADGVRRQFAGLSDDENGMDGDDDNSISSFVTQEDLSRAPHMGDFITSEALQKATVGSGLPGRSGGGSPRESQPLADIETFQDALADGSLI